MDILCTSPAQVNVTNYGKLTELLSSKWKYCIYYGTGSLTGNYTDLIATNRSRLLSMSAVLSKISLKRPSGESAKVKHMVLP